MSRILEWRHLRSNDYRCVVYKRRSTKWNKGFYLLKLVQVFQIVREDLIKIQLIYNLDILTLMTHETFLSFRSLIDHSLFINI